MEKFIKITAILMIILTLFIFIKPSITFGASITSSDYKIDTSKYKPGASTMPDKVQTTTNKVLGIITGFGAILSVVLIAAIGFSYVLGSASEKAIDQEKLITLAVGVILLTAGSGIVKLIYSAVHNW